MFRICLWNYLFKSLHLPPIFKHIMFQYTRLLIVSVMYHAVPSSSTFEYAGPFTWKARFLLLYWANTCLFFQTLHKTLYSLTSLADHCQTGWITTTTDPLSYLAHTSIRRKVINFKIFCFHVKICNPPLPIFATNTQYSESWHKRSFEALSRTLPFFFLLVLTLFLWKYQFLIPN